MTDLFAIVISSRSTAELEEDICYCCTRYGTFKLIQRRLASHVVCVVWLLNLHLGVKRYLLGDMAWTYWPGCFQLHPGSLPLSLSVLKKCFAVLINTIYIC